MMYVIVMVIDVYQDSVFNIMQFYYACVLIAKWFVTLVFKILMILLFLMMAFVWLTIYHGGFDLMLQYFCTRNFKANLSKVLGLP